MRPSEAKKDCNEKRDLKGHAMKIKIVKYLLLPIIILLLSCDGNTIFSEFEHFEDNRWFKNDVQRYEITIEQSGNYNILLHFSHVYGAPMPEIPIELIRENENNEISKETTVIKLNKSDGSALSDCTGDICDLTQIVSKNLTLSAGKYTIQVTQKFESDYLPNVIGVGISLQRADQD